MQLRSARRILKYLLFVFLANVCLFVTAAVVFAAHCRPAKTHFQPHLSTSKQDPAITALPGYVRPEDDTFLTYPEWYIVWSYQEKADFQQNHLPSGFPFFGAVRQYWSSYCCI